MSRLPVDYELCLRVRDGDEGAFRELLDRHGCVFGQILETLFLPHGDMDDARQYALIGFLKAVRMFDPARGKSFRGYASMSARRELITALAAAQREKRYDREGQPPSLDMPVAQNGHQEVTLGDTVPDPHGDTLDQVIRLDAVRQMTEGVKRLSPLERRALAYPLNGRSYVGNKRIDNAVQRARTKLKAAA